MTAIERRAGGCARAPRVRSTSATPSNRGRPRRSSPSGLHRLVVPESVRRARGADGRRGRGALRLGAVDGSTALGFAMQVHVVGALARRAGGRAGARANALFRAIVEDGALVNNAATEEGGGSPARGAIPGTPAAADGRRHVAAHRGEDLDHVAAEPDPSRSSRARIADTRPGRGRAVWLVDLAADGVERLPGFEALGMRGSASGRLVLDDVAPAERSSSAAASTSRTRAGPRRAPGSGSRSRPTYLGSRGGRADGGRSLGARPPAGRRLDRRRGPAERPASAGPDRRGPARGADRRARRRAAVGRAVATRSAGMAAAAETCRSPSSSPRARPSPPRTRRCGSPAAPGFLAGRLERAFRDARAGLINPPLEDVALAGFARRVLEEADAG